MVRNAVVMSPLKPFTDGVADSATSPAGRSQSRIWRLWPMSFLKNAKCSKCCCAFFPNTLKHKLKTTYFYPSSFRLFVFHTYVFWHSRCTVVRTFALNWRNTMKWTAMMTCGVTMTTESSTKYVCVYINQPDTESNSNPIPKPSPTTKKHAIVNIQLKIVACPMRFQRNANETCCCTVCTNFGFHCHTAWLDPAAVSLSRDPRFGATERKTDTGKVGKRRVKRGVRYFGSADCWQRTNPPMHRERPNSTSLNI